MLMIRAIVRPEKTPAVLTALKEAGFPAATKIDVFGRGRQEGVTIGEVHYNELPKQMLLIVVQDEDKDSVVQVIMESARTGGGQIGDGRIFVSPVEAAYSISTGKPDL